MEKYKAKRRLITFKCDYCGKECCKPLSEYTRNQKLGRHNFCSRNCTGKYVNTLSRPHTEKQIEAMRNIKMYSDNRNDIYTPYRSTLRRVRSRFKEVDITVEDLKELWEKQSGRCAYTHIALRLPNSKHSTDIRYQASLDRIDSSKGYVRGNIQFVAAPINFMKSTMPDNVFRLYLKEIISSICKNENMD